MTAGCGIWRRRHGVAERLFLVRILARTSEWRARPTSLERRPRRSVQRRGGASAPDRRASPPRSPRDEAIASRIPRRRRFAPAQPMQLCASTRTDSGQRRRRERRRRRGDVGSRDEASSLAAERGLSRRSLRRAAEAGASMALRARSTGEARGRRERAASRRGEHVRTTTRRAPRGAPSPSPSGPAEHASLSCRGSGGRGVRSARGPARRHRG